METRFRVLFEIATSYFCDIYRNINNLEMDYYEYHI